MRATVSLIALIAAVPAQADTFFAQAPVAEAIIYPDGATLTLRAELDLPAGYDGTLRGQQQEMETSYSILRTAILLAATMPELGTMTRRQAASLAGLAPHPNDSGTIRGYRRMRGGRGNVRAALFMAALAASRANGPLRLTYQRLVENGKKPIVAIAALMRKIIVILNARIRDDLAKQS